MKNTESIDLLMEWMKKRLQLHRDWKPDAQIPGWMRDKHLGRITELEEVIREAIEIRRKPDQYP